MLGAVLRLVESAQDEDVAFGHADRGREFPGVERWRVVDAGRGLDEVGDLLIDLQFGDLVADLRREVEDPRPGQARIA